MRTKTLPVVGGPYAGDTWRRRDRTVVIAALEPDGRVPDATPYGRYHRTRNAWIWDGWAGTPGKVNPVDRPDQPDEDEDEVPTLTLGELATHITTDPDAQRRWSTRLDPTHTWADTPDQVLADRVISAWITATHQGIDLNTALHARLHWITTGDQLPQDDGTP